MAGKATSGTQTFKGAPVPSRDLFIFRVDPETEVADIRLHLENRELHVRSLEQLSHPDAKLKSYRLSVPVSEYRQLFSEDLWPSGVRVRKYIPPRREADNPTD